jgi:hypothetical protein
MVAGQNRSDHGLLRGRLRRNHGKGRGRNLHRRGYCLMLWGQQQHDADAGRRRDRRDRREPGRHSRPHVSESRPCQLDAEGPAMARSGRRPGILQGTRHEDLRAHLVHLESSAVRNSGKMPVSPARSARRTQARTRRAPPLVRSLSPGCWVGRLMVWPPSARFPGQAPHPRHHAKAGHQHSHRQPDRLRKVNDQAGSVGLVAAGTVRAASPGQPDGRDCCAELGDVAAAKFAADTGAAVPAGHDTTKAGQIAGTRAIARQRPPGPDDRAGPGRPAGAGPAGA